MKLSLMETRRDRLRNELEGWEMAHSIHLMWDQYKY
jgi:hypothetical protein